LRIYICEYEGTSKCDEENILAHKYTHTIIFFESTIGCAAGK